MDIIFVTLPKYLVPVSMIFRKLGYQVFYLKLSGNNDIKMENIWVEKLKHAGIRLLPLEDLSYFNGAECFFDPERKILKKTQDIAPVEFLQAFEKIFPNITDITKKLQITVHNMVEIQMAYVTGNINIWAAAHPDRKYLLIDVNPLALIAPELAPNVRLLIIPLEILEKGIATVTGILHRLKSSLKIASKFKGKNAGMQKTYSGEVSHSRVAYVTHQGLNYGELNYGNQRMILFQKDLFYSPRSDSELNSEKLLHFDYSDVASPSEKIKWVSIGRHHQSWISNLFSAIVAISKGFLHIRRLRHIWGLLIVTRSYVIFRSFSKKLGDYPDLKIALIDYEILCPRELLLAFESKGIQTVAAQERFIMSFNNYLPIILNHYLCASSSAAEALKRSPLNCVDHYLPVGQYRSDHLLKAKKASPPQILKTPIVKGLKIITALGYSGSERQSFQADPLLNWKAQQNFLEDMIRLSHEIPGVFIILRYKGVDWMSLPVFAETIRKIEFADNMTISTEYNKSFFSYDLCAYSDLVIAKHTSLADECLSVGIPVLVHDYTHNTDRFVADSFDYSPTKILCFNYEELKERAQIILSGTPNAMTKDYDYLKNVVYGGLGDGKVKERIHAHIEKMLSEL